MANDLGGNIERLRLIDASDQEHRQTVASVHELSLHAPMTELDPK
jgi:hypothetical protein